MISSINNYYSANKKNIKKWIVIKSILNSIIYYKKCQVSKISIYEISNQSEKNDELSLLYDRDFSSDKFHDCYLGTNKKDTFQILQNIEKNLIYIPKLRLNFDGLYDFDSMSKTLIVFDCKKKN